MKRARSTNPLTAALLVLIAVACAVTLYHVLWPVRAPTLPPTPPEVEVTQSDAPIPIAGLGVPPFDHYAEIVDRTVFREDRRKPPPEQTEVSEEPDDEPPPLEPPAYDLIGVVTTPDRNLALLRPRSGGDVVRLPVGAELEGWRITNIDNTNLSVENAGRTLNMEIDRTSKPSAPARPASRAAPAVPGAAKPASVPAGMPANPAAPNAAAEVRRRAQAAARAGRRSANPAAPTVEREFRYRKSPWAVQEEAARKTKSQSDGASDAGG